ncbi:MAG: hypothetical protein KAT32_00625 [Candidatus Moranbacteria bacterium]|nr:hypothetical protein [Candidatus Moranbacteria bacterium]
MNVINSATTVFGIFLLLSSVSSAQAKKITIKPSIVSAVEKSCELEDPKDDCLSAKNLVIDNITPTEEILTLDIDKNGLPIAFIEMAAPINGVGCYWLKIYPQYFEKIGTPCQKK